MTTFVGANGFSIGATYSSTAIFTEIVSVLPTSPKSPIRILWFPTVVGTCPPLNVEIVNHLGV